MPNKPDTIRDSMHEIMAQHQLAISKLDDINIAYKKLQKDPNNEKMKEVLENAVKESRDAIFAANAIVLEIKFPVYSLSKPDSTFKSLREIMRSKHVNIPVLVVEDEPTQCATFKSILDNAGFEYSISSNFDDAKEQILKDIPPQIVILDLHIPKRDGKAGGIHGLELMEFIRTKSEGTNIIVETGECDVEILEKVHKLNPVRVLTKPFSIAEVEAALSMVVSKVD